MIVYMEFIVNNPCMMLLIFSGDVKHILIPYVWNVKIPGASKTFSG